MSVFTGSVHLPGGVLCCKNSIVSRGTLGSAAATVSETDGYVEYTIRVPRAEAYR